MKTTLTAFVPTHKQTNSEHAPGQQVNPINPLGFVDKTLGDYIRRKDKIQEAFNSVQQERNAIVEEQKECCGNPLRTGPNGRGCENCPPPKKLTFEEWLHHRFPAGVDGYAGMLNVGDLEQCWKAAQENM